MTETDTSDPTTRQLSSPRLLPSMDENWAMCLRCTVLADRAEKHSDELAVSTAADNEEVGSFGSVNQGGDGVSMLKQRFDRQIGIGLFYARHCLLEFLSNAWNWIRFVEHWGPGICKGPVPCHYDLQ